MSCAAIRNDDYIYGLTDDAGDSEGAEVKNQNCAYVSI
jgi:hypothetical protein